MRPLYPMRWRWAMGLGLALLGRRAAAQEARHVALKVTPQYVVVSGFWLEAEQTRARHPRQTLTLGPQLYWGPTGRPDVAFDPSPLNRDGTVRGAGLQVQQRFYLANPGTPTSYPAGLYLGYAPQLQFFRLGFSRHAWHEETGPGDLPYLVFGPVRYHEKVLRYGVAGQVGYQWPLAERVLLDVYAGLGLRQSHYWSPFAESQYRSGPSDYADRGVYFPAGFKLGVALR